MVRKAKEKQKTCLGWQELNVKAVFRKMKANVKCNSHEASGGRAVRFQPDRKPAVAAIVPNNPTHASLKSPVARDLPRR